MKKTHISAKAISRVGSNLQEKPAKPLLKKRDNIFSRSNDIHEDRATIQMKTAENPMTSPHPHK